MRQAIAFTFGMLSGAIALSGQVYVRPGRLPEWQPDPVKLWQYAGGIPQLL